MLKALLALVFLAAGGVGADVSESIDPRASYPEGPLFSGRTLLVAEMGRDQISAYEGPGYGAKRVFWRRDDCGPTAIAPYGEGGFAILCHLGRKVVIIDARGRDVRDIETDSAGAPFLDPNDCFADGEGGVYFSDPGLFSRDAEREGSLVYLAPDGAVRRLARGLWYPNGVYIDRAEHALYLSEHMAGRVLRYPILGEGQLGPPHVFAEIDFRAPPFRRRAVPYRERGPDGLERGPDGRLYVAIYGEGRVLAFSRRGRLDFWLETPMRYVTNIAFAPNGDAVVVGPHENLMPPYRGEVRRWPAAALAAPSSHPAAAHPASSHPPSSHPASSHPASSQGGRR
ncbi:MAG: SMP-30/gluconolactonase/LRE family protein [Hyphomonadaceae bacterium]|nr:SMP-30/gluconolactonase/LRE family protein [Hyphomonadaceae bacterium]